MKVLVGMSGGVDSSLTAALVREQGHEVVGATMKLWGGESDSGCCSASEVYDARRVADQLGIEHHVFNYTEEFQMHVVDDFVDAHRNGRTPNPCVECNRHIKFGAFIERATRLGFDAVATGHYARVAKSDNSFYLERAVDAAKDQSYVLSVLTEAELAKVILPIGELEKPVVRAMAEARGIRTAQKPDSQDLCFISAQRSDANRAHFLGARIPLHRGTVIEQHSGKVVGEVDAVELITVGQRRGLSHSTDGSRHYAVAVDVANATVTVGGEDDLLVRDVALTERTWVNGAMPEGTPVTVQVSAHGHPRNASLTASGIAFDQPERNVAPGQIVACYVNNRVVGSGVAS